MTENALSPREFRRYLVPLLLTVFIDLLGVGIVIPIAAPLLLEQGHHLLPDSWGFDRRSQVLGLLLASFSIAQFFGAPILGALADRYGRKRILVVSLAGTAIGYVLFALGIQWKSITLCFVSRLLDGFTGGNIAVAQSAIADITTRENRARTFGLIGMSFGIGFVLGPFLGGILADSSLVSWFRYDTPYWFAALLSAVNMVLIYLLFRETLKQPSFRPVSLLSGVQNIRRAFQMKNLRILFVVGFLFNFGFSFFTQFFQVFLIHKFSFNATDIANTFAYIGIWIAFTQGVITRRLSRSYTPDRVLMISILCQAVFLLILLIPGQSIYLYFILPFIAIFQGLSIPNITSLISLQASSSEQGSILGINQSLTSIALALPPIFAGLMTAVNVNLPILSASICILFSWLVFAGVYRVAFKRA